MKVAQSQNSEIQEIIRGMDCPKGFECYRSDFEKLGKVEKLIGAELIECVEESRSLCTFALQYGYTFFCTCPLRNYIAKHLDK